LGLCGCFPKRGGRNQPFGPGGGRDKFWAENRLWFWLGKNGKKARGGKGPPGLKKGKTRGGAGPQGGGAQRAKKSGGCKKNAGLKKDGLLGFEPRLSGATTDSRKKKQKKNPAFPGGGGGKGIGSIHWRGQFRGKIPGGASGAGGGPRPGRPLKTKAPPGLSKTKPRFGEKGATHGDPTAGKWRPKKGGGGAPRSKKGASGVRGGPPVKIFFAPFFCPGRNQSPPKVLLRGGKRGGPWPPRTGKKNFTLQPTFPKTPKNEDPGGNRGGAGGGAQLR